VVSVKKTLDFWIKNNGCSENPVEKISVDSTDDDTKAIRSIYQGNSDVIYWLIQGGGHTWPKGWHYLSSFIVGKTSEEINASEEIWKFFSDKKLVK
jgi:polyhydroxybutyrate depolymerase